MISNPDEWRTEQHRFRPDATREERKEGHNKARADAKAYEKHEKFSDEESDERGVKVEKRHFYNWLHPWEPEMSQKDVDALWDRMYKEQKGANNKGEKKRIWYEHPVADTHHRTGRRSSRGVLQDGDINDEIFNVRNKMIQKPQEAEDSSSDSEGNEPSAMKATDVSGHYSRAPPTLPSSSGHRPESAPSTLLYSKAASDKSSNATRTSGKGRGSAASVVDKSALSDVTKIGHDIDDFTAIDEPFAKSPENGRL